MDDEIGPNTVTLSAAKGLSRWASRCFAALSMTGWVHLKRFCWRIRRICEKLMV